MVGKMIAGDPESIGTCDIGMRDSNYSAFWFACRAGHTALVKAMRDAFEKPTEQLGWDVISDSLHIAREREHHQVVSLLKRRDDFFVIPPTYHTREINNGTSMFHVTRIIHNRISHRLRQNGYDGAPEYH